MSTRQDVIAKTKPLVVSAASERGLPPLQTYVGLALEEFTRFAKAREIEETITGDGTDEYDMPSGWDDDLSVIVSVVYWPANDTSTEPTRINSSDYKIENRLPSDATTQLRLLTIAPTSVDRVVMTYTAPHIIGETAATSSVPSYLTLGLAYLAASMLLDAAAASTAGTVPQASDMDALLPSFGTAGDAYRRLATRYAAKADDMLGIDRSASDTPGQPLVVSTRAQPNRTPGRRYMTHGRRAWRQ